MIVSKTPSSNYPFYQFCLAGEQQNFLQCTNCIILGVLIILLISILVLQLLRRFKAGTKRFSKKCIILYMIIANFISKKNFLTNSFLVLFVDSTIISNKYIVELEPFWRTTVFIFFYYYISLKLSKLSSHRKRTQKRFRYITLFLVLLIIVSLTFVFIELIMSGDDFYECQFKYSKISRIFGGCVTVILVVFSMKLQKKVDNHVQPIYQDLPLLQMKTFQNNETQREDLRILITMYCASQFLTICQMIYYIVKQSINAELQFPNCTPCQMIPCLQMSKNNTIAFEIFLKLSFQTIIIVLPYLALTNFFWVNSTKIHSNYHRTVSNEEDVWVNFFKKMGYEKSKISDITEEKAQSLDLSK